MLLMSNLRLTFSGLALGAWIYLPTAAAQPARATKVDPPDPYPASSTAGALEAPSSNAPASQPPASAKTLPWKPRVASSDKPSVLASVLPCGLRVLVAQDHALPVAAVVLSVPSGTGDDPRRNPGLVHALAYALQMGNRELSPGAALDEIYDSGGFAEMAVGVGQTRFESLVPHWSLKGVLRVEADRFSTPTLSEPLWLKSLQYAAQDRRPPHGPHRPLRAIAFENPSLLPDGRAVLPPLTKIPLPALAQYLVQHFRLSRASLAVVSDRPPKQTLQLVQSVFAKVDPATREAAPVPIISKATKGTNTSTNNKSWFLRPVAANPNAQLLAKTLCAYLGQRGSTGPALACEFHASATHPFLQIPAPEKNTEQSPLKARLNAILSGQDAQALWETAKRVQAEQQANLSSALTLARHLASLPNWEPGQGTPKALDLASLRGEPAPAQTVPESAKHLLRQMQASGLLSLPSYRLAIAAKAPPKKKN